MKLLLSVASVFSVDAVFPSWEEYKSEYGVSFNGGDDKHAANYAANLQFIGATNAEQNSFVLGVNKFTWLSPAQFLADFTGERAEGDDTTKVVATLSTSSVAADVDWSNVVSVVNPVKDQRSCGSCWAFGAVGVLEMSYAIDFSELHVLSEQQLVDCETNCLDNPSQGGCGGGLSGCAFKTGGYYPTKGVCSTADYGTGAYEARSLTCRDDGCTPVIKPGFIVGLVESERTFDDLKRALNDRPMKVSVHADTIWSAYKSGIAKETTCYEGTNHAVISVGYGPDYFKIRNSWGSEWGEGGYIRFSPETTCSTGPWAVLYRKPLSPQWSSNAITI